MRTEMNQRTESTGRPQPSRVTTYRPNPDALRRAVQGYQASVRRDAAERRESVPAPIPDALGGLSI